MVVLSKLTGCPSLTFSNAGNSSIFDYKFRNILEVSGAGAKRNYLKPFTKAPGPVPSLTMEEDVDSMKMHEDLVNWLAKQERGTLFKNISEGVRGKW